MAQADFWIKQGDTAPDIEATLEDSSGSAVDLTNASSVDFHMMDSAGNVTVDAAGTITDAANGKVKYNWASGDTDEAGTFQAEWEVTWSDSSTETFPNHDNLIISITSEIA